MAVFVFLCKTLVFLFLPSLNLGTQITCPQNWYTDLKSPLDQSLVGIQVKRQLFCQAGGNFRMHVEPV